MRQVTRKSLVTVAAAGGVLALGGGYAHADSGAQGGAKTSPGVLSGNSVQIPVHVPVNVCGNTVNVVGVLNPAIGNRCANVADEGRGGKAHGDRGHGHGTPPRGGSHDDGYGGGGSDTPPRGGAHGGSGPKDRDRGHGGHGGGAHTGGGTSHSPGVGSGNSIEIPIDIPVNVCGLGVTAVGLGNPVFGNGCENDSPEVPDTPGPGKPVQPVKPGTPGTRTIPPAPNTPEAQIAAPPVRTEELASTGAGGLGIALPVGAGLILAGSILYRRTRSAA